MFRRMTRYDGLMHKVYIRIKYHDANFKSRLAHVWETNLFSNQIKQQIAKEDQFTSCTNCKCVNKVLYT